MEEKIIDGKKIRDEILAELKPFFLDFEKKNERRAKLSVFMVGENKVIDTFVAMKKKVAESLNVDFQELRYDEKVAENFLIEEIQKENYLSDGIIVQLPLPEKFDRENVLGAIAPSKDVDLLSEEAWEEFLRMEKGEAEAKPLPPVAAAVYEILRSKNLEKAEK